MRLRNVSGLSDARSSVLLGRGVGIARNLCLPKIPFGLLSFAKAHVTHVTCLVFVTLSSVSADLDVADS